jgi:hypothetical protein
MYRTQVSQDGHTVDYYYGPWNQLVKMAHVLCEDGIERTINVREPDTFFSIPGRTQAYGKTVTGFVSYDSDLERFTFKAYTYGKNGAVIRPKDA